MGFGTGIAAVMIANDEPATRDDPLNDGCHQ